MKILINDSDVGKSNISTLIRKLNFIFNLDGRNLKDYKFEIVPKHLDAVSALIIYKFFEYSVKNSCLETPAANLDYILDITSKYGIEKLFKSLIKKEEADVLYNKLKTYDDKAKGFFIAPHAINRNNFKSKEELETKYTNFIENYYKDICPKLIPYIRTCICEIASNFLYHAVEDENSILMAQGNKNKIEIVCVDNSKGIISNLEPNSTNHKKTIKKAFERGVSSKKNKGHCGTGLWFIQKITENLNGVFRVHSEDMSYICRSGKVIVNKTSHWEGSIVHLKLNISNDTEIDDFFNNFIENNQLGLINT